MSQLTFNVLDQASGIYISTDTTNKELSLYFLATIPPSTDKPISFSELWSSESGYYFFLSKTESINEYALFATALKQTLGQASSAQQAWIAWIDSAIIDASGALNISAFFKINFSGSGGAPKTIVPTVADFLNINLNVPTGVNLTADDTVSNPVFSIQSPISGTSSITLNGDINSLIIDNNHIISVPLTGDHIGVFSFPGEWNSFEFYNLFTPPKTPTFTTPPSGEIRFQYNQNTPVNFRYPTFNGLGHSTSDMLYLNIAMDVLNPLNGKRTRFAFDLDKFSPTLPLPTANSQRSNSGSTLFLNPKPTPSNESDPLQVAGFAVGNRPNENDNNEKVLYLLPIGNYAVHSSSPPPETAGLLNVMCGLIGTEFLLAAEGDLLEFTNQAKSLATGYAPESKTNTDTVSDTYTTSWLRLIPGPNSETVFSGSLKESYCVQSPNSIYYSPGSKEGFSLATGVRLASISDINKTVPFPMVPYGSVYYSDSSAKIVTNPSIVPSTFTSFEYDVLSPLRRKLIDPDLCNGPIFFSAVNGIPLDGGYVRSPIGLLAELNNGKTPENTPAGTIKRLLLAKSPVTEKFLQFTAAPSPYCDPNVPNSPTVVSPKLSTALMNNSVFLVASDSSLGNIGPFDNEIQLGEFTYQINLSGKVLNPKDPITQQKRTIMLFKFSANQTVEDLAADTNQWTDPTDFVGDTDAINNVSKAILKSIEDAKVIVDAGGTPAKYFKDFYNKMTDPNWTGMIVLNCELDYQLLPTDIQVLLGGIDGELIAHHFGVTVNQINLNVDNPTVLEIDNSSLFSLIYYDKDYAETDKTFEFQVTKLNVLYVNSVMTQFQSQIAMTVKELYGDTVKLDRGGPNDILDKDVIVIDGVYLKDGETGHIVFDSTTPRFFSFPHNNGTLRVLTNVVITDATLIPISSTPDPSNPEITIVKAAFRLNGEFGFNPDVSTTGSKVDLFSYPINEDSGNSATLNFTNNALDWDTDIKDKSANIQYPIVSDLSNLKLESSTSTPRNQSLVATFPLNLVSFNWSPNGLKASSIGAKQIKAENSPNENPLDVNLGNGNPPEFSLVFSLNMGNLGMLTSGVALQATAYLGWSSAGTDPAKNNDMSFLFVPPTEFSSGDGGFKLQGIIDTVYGDLMLKRLPLDSETPPNLLFVLSLKDVQLSLLSIALLSSEKKHVRNLTLFGDPNKPQGSNLSWFLSNPNPVLNPPPIDIDIVQPQAGIMNGININSDFTGTQVISKAISNLEGVLASSDSDVIKNIYQGTQSGTDYTYDPKAGVLFYIDLQFVAFTFQMLMADPSFYGALLKIGKQEEGGFLEKWSGLEIELVYRKISEGLGVISTHFSIPKAIRTIPNAEAPTNFTFPSFGLEVFTNGDWKIEIGWPFPSDNNAKIAFILYGVPVFVGIGLYIAKLRGADVPGVFPESFKLIWMFGLGLSFGIEKEYPVVEKPKEGEKAKPKGVISASFSLYIWASFQGMLASKTGSITEDGVDYQWWTTTLGVTLNLQGSVDLKIISASIEIEATIYITFALETGHQTVVKIGADFKIKLTVKILFIKIHITFKHHFDLAEWYWGSGPPALASGPTPCKLEEYAGQPGCPPLASAKKVNPSPMMAAEVMPMYRPMAMSPQAFTESFITKSKERTSPEMRTPITLYYLLQPTTATANNGSTWDPLVVSSLLIEMSPSNTGTGENGNSTTEFSKLLNIIANYLVSILPPETGSDLNAQFDAMSVLTHSNEYFAEADSFLKTDILFTIDKSSNAPQADSVSYTVFPMFSQCEVTYNGDTTPLNTPVVPDNYVKEVQEYLNQYNTTDSSTDANEKISVEDMLVKDYLVMLAQQLVYELGLTLSLETPPTTLASALLMVDNSNIAGFVSQFMLQGLRLPTFSGNTVNTGDNDWQGIYQLAGLQTKLILESGTYITQFTLGLAESSASDFIKFAGVIDPDTGKEPETLEEDFPTNQVLDAKPSTAWLTPPGGISILDPLASSQKTYNLQQPNSYTNGSTTSKLFPLPNAMQRDLERLGGMEIDLSLISNNDSGASQSSNIGTPVVGNPALFIPITINKVALPGADTSEAYYENTYAVKGTDQYTRELLELLLKNFDADSSNLTLMIGTGKNDYVAPTSTDSIILVKNNLSTDAEPETVLLAKQVKMETEQTTQLGPVQASLADKENFLRLIWEESVVRTAGYYLHLDKIPEASFTGESATIALMISNKAGATSNITLKNYHNLIDISQALEKGALAAAAKDSSNNPVLVYQPNYALGNTGFSVKWLDAISEPDISDTSEYITALYRTIQFKVDSIEGSSTSSKDFNWSKPNGANSVPTSNPNKDNWIFRQTIPAFKFINKENPYDSIGKNVTLDIRILDMYGNALPTDSTNQQSTRIVYNDPLTTFAELQWFKIVYSVASQSSSPVLDIDLDFDADTVTNLASTGGDDGVSQIYQALAEYNKAIGQFSDSNVTLTAKTSLSGTSFTKDRDNNGTSIKSSILSYLTSVAVFLQDVLTQKTQPSVPIPIILRLELDFTYVKKMDNALFVVTAEVIVKRESTTSSVTDLLPSVGTVTNVLVPYVTPAGSDPLKDTPSMAAFADQFEKAYDGFDGADGQLKIGTGSDFSAGLQNAQKNVIWAMKWSENSGLAIDVPYDTAPAVDNSPSFYAPVPLSTQLITRQEKVIIYNPTWNGTGSDIEKTVEVNFANIDMNAWASQFLNTFHEFITPEMAGAIAKLSGSTYEDLMSSKNKIADAISKSIELIITPDTGKLDTDLESAQERMLQSLLTSLTNDYGTSALVQVPTDVTVIGQVEPGVNPDYPPTGFGKVSAKEDTKETPYTVSNAYLPLVDEPKTNQYLNFLIAAKHPEKQADLKLDLFYDIGFINHQLEASDEDFGFVPSSWITVVLPERLVTPLPPALLQVPLSNLDIPIPLRSFPAPPSFGSQTAVGKPDSTNIEELIEWTYTVELSRTKALQDEIHLEVSYNEDVDGPSTSNEMSRFADPSKRPDPVDLYEALARFIYEYPEIEPHLNTIPDAAFEGKDVEIATAALSRMTELINGIAGTWGNWKNPAVNKNNMRLAEFSGPIASSGITPIDQKYKFNFSNEGKTITVTGLKYTSNVNSPLSELPYPDITGYSKGTMDTNQVIYTLKTGEAPASVELSYNALNIGTHQSAISRAFIERNADIAPAGFTTNEAFIFHTPIVSFKNPIVPLIEANETITLPEAANLSAVISAFFNDFLGENPEKSVVLELQFTLEAGAEFLMSSNPSKNQTLVSKTPILFSQTSVATPSNSTGTPSTTLSDYEAQLVSQILAWHESVSANNDSPTQMLYLSFVLFADVSESKLPLLRIRDLLIKPPTNNLNWWS